LDVASRLFTAPSAIPEYFLGFSGVSPLLISEPHAVTNIKLLGIGIATVLIFIRCVYRVAELAGGFDSAIANSEPAFMIFEGPMIIIAVALITWFHPGRVFRDLWVPAGQGLRANTMGMKPMHFNGSDVQLSEGEGFKNNWRGKTQRV
jgi:hypothetical protein